MINFVTLKNMAGQSLSLEELTRFGEKIYEELRESLEKKYMGQFVVIDVEEKKYEVDPDRLLAIEKAKKKFGDKLFYIIQVGDMQKPNKNFSEELGKTFILNCAAGRVEIVENF